MINNHINGELRLYLIIFILCGLLIPISVSAQCGDCDDRNPCTKDICNGTKCEHIPQICLGGFFQTYRGNELSSNASMPWNANNSSNITMGAPGAQPQGYSVVQPPISCEDYNPCTIDYYGPAGCVNDPVNCDDGNPATKDYCTATGCVHDPVSCDDGNPCTNDYFGLAGCVNDQVSCDDASEDIRSYCGCPSPEVKEDASSPEPQNVTIFGVKLSRDKEAEDNEAQEENTSASPEKDLTAPKEDLTAPKENLNATEENLTTPKENLNATEEDLNSTAMSEMRALVYNVSECDDGDSCTDDHLVNGKCKHFMKICNDNIPSNFDYCYQGNCSHAPINCDDGDKCTVDSFDGAACVYTPTNCDDGNPCTEDSCNKLAGCQNMEINEDNNYCTIECENGNPVFKPLICDDANPCTRDYCDKSRGCVHVPICGPFYHNYFPYSHYLPIDYLYPYIGAYPTKYYYPYSPAPVVAAPAKTTPVAAAPNTATASTTGTGSTPATKSYTINTGTVITLPWNDTVTALDSLQVENGVAYSSGSGIRFSRQMGTSKVYQQSSGQNLSDRAEMVGVSWPEKGIPFTLTLTQPNGTILSVQDDDMDAMHLTGSNYDYYFLRNPAKGYWTVVVTPAQSASNGIGFSLISGMVEGIVPPEDE